MAAVIPRDPDSFSSAIYFRYTVLPLLEELVGEEGGKISQIERINNLLSAVSRDFNTKPELTSIFTGINKLLDVAKILPPERWRVFRLSTIQSIADKSITLASCTESLEVLTEIEPSIVLAKAPSLRPQIKGAIPSPLASSSSTMSAYNHLSSVMATLAAKKDENILKEIDIALAKCKEAKAKYAAQSEVGCSNIIAFASYLNTIRDLIISLGSSEKRQKVLFKCIDSLLTKGEFVSAQDASDISSYFNIFLTVFIEKDPSIFSGKLLCELIDYGLLNYMNSEVPVYYSLPQLSLDEVKDLITMYLSSFDNMYFLAHFMMAYECVISIEALKFMMDSILSNSDNDRVFKLLCSAFEVNFDGEYIERVERDWINRMAKKFAQLGHDDKAKECQERLHKIDAWLLDCDQREKAQQAILAGPK